MLSGPPGGPESLNVNLYLSFLGFWRARKLKHLLLGPPGGARNLKSKVLGPRGGPKPSNLRFLALPRGTESLNINLYLGFLGFWKARNRKFMFLGPPGAARKLKFRFLVPPGGPKPSNLCFMGLPGAQKA